MPSSAYYDEGAAVYNALAASYGMPSSNDSPAINTLANSTIPSSGGILFFPPNVYNLGADVTFPEKVEVAFAPGAVLKLAAGVTVKFLGPIDAEPTQIFDISAAGSSVMFASAANTWDKTHVRECYPEWWGTNGSVSPYDTAAVQAAFDSSIPVRFCRHYYVTTVDLTSSEHWIDFDKFKLIGAASGTDRSVDAVLRIRCSHSTIYNLRVDAGYNTAYKAAVRWFGDATHVYPGRNTFFGFRVENSIYGLVIGAHPGDTPYNCPLSENSIYAFQAVGCQIPLYANQPNGKLQFSGGTFSVDIASWQAANPGKFSYANGVAIYNEPSASGGTVGGAELVLLGCEIINNQSSDAANGYGIRGANIHAIGCLWEVIGANYIAGDRVIIEDNEDAVSGIIGTKPAFIIDSAATGRLVLSRAYAQKSVDSGTPFVDGSANHNFVVVLDSCDIDGWRWSHISQYAPLIKDCQVQFVGSTRFRNASTDCYVHGDRSTNLLTTADTTGDTFGASIDQSAKGGWTFFTGGGSGNKFGKSTDVPSASYPASIDLLSAAAQAGQITTAQGTGGVRVFPNKTVLVRTWAKPVTSGSNVIIRAQWYRFDGSASATASSDLLSASMAQLGWTIGSWIPLTLLAQAPSDAAYMALMIYCDNGVEARFTGLQVE